MSSVPTFVYSILMKQKLRRERKHMNQLLRKKELVIQKTESPIVRHRLHKEVDGIVCKLNKVEDQINLNK